MKNVKKIAFIYALMNNNKNSCSFTIPQLKKPKNRNLSNTNKVISHLSKSKNNNMLNDDALFDDLFNNKTNNTEIIDNKMIDNAVKQYMGRQNTDKQKLLEEQKPILDTLKIIRANRQDIAKSILLRTLQSEHQASDDAISPNENFIGSFTQRLKKFPFMINDVYLGKNSRFLQEPDAVKAVKILLRDTNFDETFVEKKVFTKQKFIGTQQQEGLIIKANYQDTNLYFLITLTKDKNIRLLDIQSSKDEFKDSY